MVRDPASDRHADRSRLSAAFDLPGLEREAVQLLQDGRAQDAFRHIDRRCRIGPWTPHCLVLRAEALDRMGLRDLAIVDLRRALDAAPDDRLANRRMMLWTDGLDRLAAATALVDQEFDPVLSRQAFQVLAASGSAELARIRVVERRIAGWAAWGDGSHAELRVAGETDRRWTLRSAGEHPLGQGSFTRFNMALEASEACRTVSIGVDGRVLATARIGPRRVASAATAKVQRSARPDRLGVTVIVPVYADFEATRLCLDRVLRSFGRSRQHRLVVVDDASPEPALSAHLRALAQAESIELLVNADNLGFVGSVNRALAAVPDGDIVLLNADTVVPRGFVDRLAAAARSAPGIGTVTPLSNNGEFLSFPRPNRSNPLPKPEALDAIDRTAASVNAGQVVDLPSGIGFCLYVARACLDAVGGLSEDYHRGYLEDVDFCLRARAAGFRNVAAPSVFVGHAGSRSFASSKRGLVVMNLAVLEQRFPEHRGECTAFMAADPLHAARNRIERDLGVTAVRPVILVATRPLAAIARDRGRHHLATGRAALLVDVVGGEAGASVRARDLSGGTPQSVQFALGAERAALRSFLETAEGATIEILDAHRLPGCLSDLLSELALPTDLVLADGAVLPALGRPGILPSRWPSDARPCDMAAPSMLPRFDRIVAPDADADALLRRAFPTASRPSFAPRARRAKRRQGSCHLGFVPVFDTPSERVLIGTLADALAARCPGLPMTVLGPVSGEAHLAHRDGIFVTGPVDDDDLDHVRSAHAVTALLILLDRPLFGHPRVAAARRCDCPLAAPDWSGSDRPPLSGDLAIPPSTSIAEAADHLVRWLHTDWSAAARGIFRRHAEC